MEYLLHYVWKHRLYGSDALVTDQGEPVDVIDPGLHNMQQSGPDFFNAKVRVNGVMWAGNVEIHERSSDWYRHHHDRDAAYNNVVLHIASQLDTEVRTCDGRVLPQLKLEVPAGLAANYRELLAEETYPPCYRVIPQVKGLTANAWMSRLTVERLEEKMRRADNYLKLTGGDWERVFFITLARNFGFGNNAQAFEQWALSIDLTQVGHHRDDAFQVEAFFMGQAGLLAPEVVKPERRDVYYQRLCQEYVFLQRKFNLQPLDTRQWKFGRLRPQNFPHVRISQLTQLYVDGRACFSRLLEARDVKQLHQLFRTTATPYWCDHYTFGEPSPHGNRELRKASLDLIIINTAAPLLFAYGRHLMDEGLAERAFALLEQLPAERNYITRCWERAGLSVQHAADSQALIHLRQHYCDRKDCLRCRFGTEYLRRQASVSSDETVTDGTTTGPQH